MEKKIKEVQFKKKFKFKKEQDEYTFQLKKKRNYWWLLLCLLPLLLFIRCDHDITVKTIDSESKQPVADVLVTMEYMPHLLYEKGKFLPYRFELKEQTTDSTGTTVFKNIKCDVFSYIFYCMSKVSFEIFNDCFTVDPNPVQKPYHYTRHVEIELVTKREDVKLFVKDKETDSPLADAKIEYQYVDGGKQRTDTVRSNANGEAVVAKMPSCGVIDLIKVSCYGYVDTLVSKKAVADLRGNEDSATLRLRPVKQSFSYFVKNKETRQPIPGAKCVVTLTDKANNTTRGTSTTNVDGMGKGVYDDAFILAHLDIEASKPRFKTGKLEGNYTVEQFRTLPDSMRVIYLEPEPYVQEFQNVDSLTNQPIVGVTNEITVTDFNGNKETYTEISNRNGFFPVKAKEGDKIEIVSKLEPDYITKNTYIAKFDSAEVIKMVPDKVSLTFRTVEVGTNDLLPDCDLQISTTKTKITVPINSGTGEFVVNGLNRGENISIISSKQGYITNDTTIKNLNVDVLLKSPQSARDIPMSILLLSCDPNVNNHQEGNVAAGTVSPPRSYNMGRDQGRFKFTFETGPKCPDSIVIYNHKPNEKYSSGHVIHDTRMRTTENGPVVEIVEFLYGSVVTVVVTTGHIDGSEWLYKISCPL